MNDLWPDFDMAEPVSYTHLDVYKRQEERKALKQIALDKDMTVSALLREWLKEYQAKEAEQ